MFGALSKLIEQLVSIQKSHHSRQLFSRAIDSTSREYSDGNTSNIVLAVSLYLVATLPTHARIKQPTHL